MTDGAEAPATGRALLKAAALGTLPDGLDAAGALAEHTDPGALLADAARHGLVPALARLLIDRDLIGALPHTMGKHLIEALHGSMFKAHRHTEEAVRLTQALHDARVRAAWTKGVVLQEIYAGGTRVFSDIDLMIAPDDRETTAEVLQRLGYAPQRSYDHRSGRLVELERSRALVYRLYPDHLPHFYRLTGEPWLPFIAVDVAYSASWYGCAWQLPPEKVMGELEAVAVPGGQQGTGAQTLPTLSAPYAFLFLVLHLFREAWFARSFRAAEVRLAQFADLVRFWHAHGDQCRTAVPALIEEYELADVAAWVCTHTDAVFGTRLAEAVGVNTSQDKEWLSSVGGPSGECLRWHGDMERRLWADEPLKLIPMPPPAPAAAAHGRIASEPGG